MSRARKSSVDNARRPLKAHIPYRADDLTHGKKTGVNVREVDRRSDGFESFGEVLTQADVVTPPHMHARRRTRRSPSLVPEYDEDGSMSMELDNSRMDSPNMYFNNAPRLSAPTSANRSTATSHVTNRSSYVDYDRVPSPRASSSSQVFRSHVNGSAAGTPASRFKSNLSQQTVIPSSPEDDDQSDDDGNDSFGDNFGGNDNFDYDRPAPEDSSSPTRRTSFTVMDQDDDEPPPEVPQISSPQQLAKKGRQKTSMAVEEIEVEAEIARGLNDSGMGSDVDLEEREEENRSRSQKKRGRDEEPPKVKKAPAKRKKVQVELPPSEEHNSPGGVRRGKRTRYKPLEWWRCEKVVYGRRDSGVSMVPVIKDIIRLPKEIPEPLAHSGRRSSKPRSRSKPHGEAEENEDEGETIAFNPEEGWDDRTDPHGVVLDYQTGQEVQRRLAFTAKMVIPKTATNNDFAYQKIFGDGEFIAAGQLILPVGGKKPSKGTKDNTYVFYLIEGAVQLKIHRSSFVLASGGMFLIPRGNTYYLENISERPAKLFFAQARKVNAEDEPPQEVVKALPPKSGIVRTKSADPTGARRPSGASGGYSSTGAKSGSIARSSSAAATSPDKVNGRKPSAKRAVSK